MRFQLTHKLARERAKQAIDTAQEGWVVTIAEPTRKEAQSARFHAICTDLARSDKMFQGKRRNKDEWKLLLISAHSHVTKQGSEIVAGLEGEWLNIRESSARMGIKRMASLIEYAEAWCAMNEVKLSAPDIS